MSDTRLDILAFCPVTDYTGSGRSLVTAAGELAAAGRSIAVAVLREGMVSDELRALGIEVITLIEATDRKHEPRWRTQMLRTRALARWAGLVVRRRPRRVWVNTCRLVSPALVAWLAGVPVVLHYREPEYYLEQLGVIDGWIVRRVPSTIIAVSENTRAQLIRHRFAAEKIVVVPNAIDCDRFAPAEGLRGEFRERFDLPADAPVVGMVAGFRPEKGIDVFLEAAREVLRHAPETRFVIAGGAVGGTYDRTVLQSIVQSDAALGARVQFVGVLEDIRGMLAACDVVVVPSRDEPFGRVCIEAMAMERPVVASRTGGLAEIIEDGRSGLLAEVGAAPQFAEAILRLLADAAWREEIGRQGRRRVVEHYGRERLGRRLAEIFQNEGTTIGGTGAFGPADGTH